MSTSINLKTMFDELQSKPKCDDSELPSFDVERHRESMRLLAMIDKLDELIAAETVEASKKTLRGTRSAVAHKFAQHLDADTSRFSSAYIVADDHRHVWVVQEITGPPSLDYRQQADEWTASRGQPWKGETRRLHALMRQALRNGEKLPDGNFGVHVARTIRIGQWSNDDAREWENAQPPLGPDDLRF
ncbi:hypothetical protein [Bradyrhizobium australiense]|uniref:Uncharacterized protein n=1 Tax=Bradyrhizobium australiense TaxID=2721161 RepID=A0A7Y4LVB4_9BRAD|nr:hypothetical protein [Bradyrhizobium australiense]NOJ40006.1 hypothetical protein [Bradyrhizobium australiense]